MSITVCIQDDNSNMVVQGHLYPENDISSTRFFTFTDRLMRWFQPKLFVQDESIPDIEPDVIYSLAKSKQQHWVRMRDRGFIYAHADMQPTIPQPEQLLHPLRSYQAQAVRWMVDREQTPTTEGRSAITLFMPHLHLNEVFTCSLASVPGCRSKDLLLSTLRWPVQSDTTYSTSDSTWWHPRR